jgi:hypothetical protein
MTNDTINDAMTIAGNGEGTLLAKKPEDRPPSCAAVLEGKGGFSRVARRPRFAQECK